MMGRLSTLKSSARNWAPNRSVNLKFLNMEKSTFLKPASRKMFRPMVPKVPALGGTKTEFPSTKQPPAANVPGSGATAVHFAPSDEGNGVTMPLTPDVVVHVAGPGKPVQYGMELEVALKSVGFPKKSQRSVFSLSLLKLSDPSITFQGCEPERVTMVLSFQPSNNCPKPFFPGMS